MSRSAGGSLILDPTQRAFHALLRYLDRHYKRGRGDCHVQAASTTAHRIQSRQTA